ncbi:T6SS immunity protein Tli4 family protein [Niveibacterium sp. SC-1]|uniref:T6SS immunity protein Tli4 family protein n=1 Tax=Niveibacterium sp. SC-1 TaxID=3135646 RepID=UPI00311DCF3B
MTAAPTCRNWLVVFAFGLAACQPTGAQAPRPVPSPTEQDIASAYHPSHKTPAGTRSECLGRLIFEVPSQPRFEWGLPRQVRNNYSILGFSRILSGGQDMIHIANVAVVVAAEATPKTIQEMQRITGVQKNIALQDFDEDIRQTNSVIDSLTLQMAAPQVQSNPKELAGFKESIGKFKRQLEAYKSDKIALDKDWHPTNWNLPDSTGYIAGPTLYAFVLRDGFAFQFMSTGGEGEARFEQRLAAFKDLLSRFEYRPLYHVPNTPGLCIPHGFIRDDGKGHFNAEVSYRFTDSPGVIYTLGTAIEGERNFNPNEPLLEATARSTVASLVGNGYGRKLKALGPRSTNIGARSGVMGGIYATEGVPGYSVYVGARGWDHSQVLPFISLNMRSFDSETAPEDLKVNPPAVEQSMKRFELTLSSLRTRKVP